MKVSQYSQKYKEVEIFDFAKRGEKKHHFINFLTKSVGSSQFTDKFEE